MDNANKVTNCTSCLMVYGSEVVLPTKLQYGSLRVQAYEPIEAKLAWQGAINLFEQSLDITVARSTRY
jgi:hypothetical protein